MTQITTSTANTKTFENGMTITVTETSGEYTRTLNRWTKNGKDRIYINDYKGRSEGYVDLQTMTAHVGDLLYVNDIADAIIAMFTAEPEEETEAETAETVETEAEANAEEIKKVTITYDNNTCEIEYTTPQEYALLRKLENESAAHVEKIRNFDPRLVDSSCGKVWITGIHTEYGIRPHIAHYNPDTHKYETSDELADWNYDSIIVTFRDNDGEEWVSTYNPETLIEQRSI